MIVRILSEGQFEVPEALLDRLNEADNALVEVVAGGDRQRFRELFTEMLELVRRDGKPLGWDDLRTSEVVLPAPDTTFEEAREVFRGEGLIPD